MSISSSKTTNHDHDQGEGHNQQESRYYAKDDIIKLDDKISSKTCSKLEKRHDCSIERKAIELESTNISKVAEDSRVNKNQNETLSDTAKNQESSDINTRATNSNHNIRSLTASDFYFGHVVGEGSYGSVFHAKLKKHYKFKQQQQDKDCKNDYCIKIMEKRQILREQKEHYIMMEKNILQRFISSTVDADKDDEKHLIVKLYGSFHDAHYLYLVLEFCAGGDLSHFIKWKHSTSEHPAAVQKNQNPTEIDSTVLYYAGQILRALEFIHCRKVIHRDIKPQNILLTSKGRIKVTDFGAAMDFNNPIKPKKKRQNSFRNNCDSLLGTAEYISPEALLGTSALTPSVDLWAYGCIIYEMLVGTTPFYNRDHYVIFQTVLSYARRAVSLPLPSSMLSPAAQDLVRELLCPDSSQRLGARDEVFYYGIDDENYYTSIRSHAFFDNLSWDDLDHDTISSPPYKPPKPAWLLQPFPMRSTSSAAARSNSMILQDWVLKEDVTPLFVANVNAAQLSSLHHLDEDDRVVDDYEKEGEEKTQF